MEWRNHLISNYAQKTKSLCAQLPADGIFELIGIQIWDYDQDPTVYVDVLGLPMRSDSTENPYVGVRIVGPNETMKTLAYCHKGGQRLLLNDQAARFLLGVLEEGEPCTVCIGSLERLIPPL